MFLVNELYGINKMRHVRYNLKLLTCLAAIVVIATSQVAAKKASGARKVRAEDKDDRPKVAFTGGPFRASFANFTLYQPVTLNLAEESTKKRRAGK
jgi:lipopolysaccharide export LptBFGC system permease protein LptF